MKLQFNWCWLQSVDFIKLHIILWSTFRVRIHNVLQEDTCTWTHRVHKIPYNLHRWLCTNLYLPLMISIPPALHFSLSITSSPFLLFHRFYPSLFKSHLVPHSPSHPGFSALHHIKVKRNVLYFTLVKERRRDGTTRESERMQVRRTERLQYMHT